MCPLQIECVDYKWKHRIRSHHVRQVEECVRYTDGSCPLMGKSCDIEKVKRIKVSRNAGIISRGKAVIVGGDLAE